MLKQEVVLDLGDLAPPWLVATFPDIPGLAVTASENSTLPVLDTPGGRWRLLPAAAPGAKSSVEDLQAWADRLAGRLRPQARQAPIVIDSFLSAPARKALDHAGISYVDTHGHLSLSLPGVLVRLHPASRPVQAANEGLGVVGVRAAQVLLEEPVRPWAGTELSERAGVSTGQAHRVFSILEGLDLVEVIGSGRNKRRRLRSPARVLDWLAATAPRHIRVKRRAFLYAPGPDQLLRRLGQAIDGADLPAALSGAAGAVALGAGPSRLPLVVVRVAPVAGLDHVARILGAEVVDQGANLELWADTGELGTHHRGRVGAIPVAPAVRVYLDCFHSTRGEDVAEQFREQVIGW